MRALLFLEVRRARNAVRTLLRSPGRVAVWILYVVILTALWAARSIGPRHGHSSAARPFVTDAIAAIGTGWLFGSFGVYMLAAAVGRVIAFRSRPDALVLCTSGITPRFIALSLSLRTLAASIARFGLLLLFYAFLFGLGRASPTTVTSWGLVALLVGCVASLVSLPVFLLTRRAARMAFQMLGIALVAIALVYACLGVIAAVGDLSALHLLHRIPAAPPQLTRALLLGRPAVLAVFIAGLFALPAATYWLGADALPELYEASANVFALRERRTAQEGPAAVVGSDAAALPRLRGALSVIWRDARVWRRTPVGSIVAIAAVLAVALAFALGATMSPDDAAVVFAPLAFLAMTSLPRLAARGLAHDVGKPLWWLSVATLRARLWAWTVSKAWGPALALGLVAAGVTLRNGAVPAIVAASVTAVFTWTLYAFAVALFTWIPSPVDAAGPVYTLRTIGSLALLLPPVGVSIATFVLTSNVAVATAVALLVACGQGIVLLELAALRIVNGAAAIASSAAAL